MMGCCLLVGWLIELIQDWCIMWKLLMCWVKNFWYCLLVNCFICCVLNSVNWGNIFV